MTRNKGTRERVREHLMRSRPTLLHVGGLSASIAAISVLRYYTNGPVPNLLHELSLNLYYIPILVGAYWYGVPGGLITALISSIVYVNRATAIASTYDPARVAEVAAFHLVAIVVGLLASAQRRVTERYRELAHMVERANAELRDSHDQARRADRLRTIGEVATGIAHEIRHPLASIRGAVEIIESRASPDSPEAEFSRLAMSEVRRLDRMTWEFLQYARPHDPEPRRSSVHDVTTQAVTLLREEAERAGLQLDLKTPDRDLHADIDPLQIEQVLLNVILNAIQATPPGGRVVIREQIVTAEVCIDIIDEGPGIPPDHHGRIFDPFFTTRGKGTGLGLAIAHRIVAAHEGRLKIVSTSASGTHFGIFLPVNGPRRAGPLPATMAPAP